MSQIKTILTTKSYRKKWIGWIIGTTIFFTFMILMLDCYRLSKHFSLNPFTFIKVYIDHKASPPYFLVFLAFLVALITTTSRMSRMLADLKLRGVDWSENNTYGSAQEATAEDIKEIANVRPIDQCVGPIHGRLTPNDDKSIVEFRTDKNLINGNVMVVGAPGSGKSFCYVKNAIYQAIKRGESIIVADTKGEIFNSTAELPRKHGYVVRCFNTKDFEYSHSWNCFRELYDENGELSADRVETFCDVVVRNITSEKTEPIYITGPKALLQSALLYIGSNDTSYGDEPGKQPRTLYSAYRFLLDNNETQLDALFDPDLGSCCEEAILAYKSYKDASQNVRGNLKTNLTTGIQSLAIKKIRDITSYNEIDLSLPAKQKCVYYITVPDNNRAYDFYSALFIEFLFKDLTSYADTLTPQECPVHVNVILDEFANLGKLLNFSEKPATTRSRGIPISIIVQSFDQLRNKYQDWEAILTDCGTWLGIGFNDDFTQDYFSRMIGQATISTKSEQYPAHMPWLSSAVPHSEGEGKRNVMNPDELRRMNRDECVILYQTQNVLRAYKCPHTLHKFAKECIPTQVYYIPKVENRTGRAYWFAMEEERIAQFAAWENGGRVGVPPKIYTLEELASGKYSLEDYRASYNIDTLQISDIIVWNKIPGAQRPEFLGKLQKDKEKQRKKEEANRPIEITDFEIPAIASIKEETISEQIEPQVPPVQERKEKQNAEPQSQELPTVQPKTTPNPATQTPSNAPVEISDILNMEASQNTALEQAFGKKTDRANRGVPKTGKK